MNYDKYRYRRLNLDDLETNKKYRFYKNDNTNFTAIFDSIFSGTLIVRHYETGKINDNYAIRTMPKEWISYVESEEYKIKINNFLN
jgi:hypothetical protein